jgi:hypothetical protein
MCCGSARFLGAGLRRHDAQASARLPQFGIETLQLARAFLPRPFLVHLRARPLRARVVRRMSRGRRDLLLVVQLLLPPALVDLQYPRRRGRTLRLALLLQHAQLQLVLLLLALQLVALQLARRGIGARCRTRRQRSRDAECER